MLIQPGRRYLIDSRSENLRLAKLAADTAMQIQNEQAKQTLLEHAQQFMAAAQKDAEKLKNYD